jgi:outer membrane lipoprotein SlyB
VARPDPDVFIERLTFSEEISMKPLNVIAVVALAAAGCANYQPIIDTRGVDPINYRADLADCQAYAGQVDPAAGAAAGAIAGALLGVLLGRIVNDSNAGMKLGAVMGASGGAGEAARSQQEIVKNCMRGRGYSVLY